MHGFKKSGQVWYYKNNDIYLLCEYQGSYIFSGFYLNFGLYFSLLKNNLNKVPRSDAWHFNGRYDQLLKGLIESPENYISFDQSERDLILNLEKVKANIEKLILPHLFQMKDYNYFTVNFPSNFDHNKLWFQNISQRDFIDFVKSKQG